MNISNSVGGAGKLARQGEGKVLMILGMPHFIKIQSDQNATSTSLMEVIIAPGQGVPPHIHTREDEIFCILQGEVSCQMEGLPTPVTLKPGDAVFLPRNQAHGFTNASAKDARVMVTVLPGTGMDRFFTELDAACKKITDQQKLLPEIGRIAGNYGLRFA